MIIVGAKGFAKEILQIVSVDMGLPDDDIVFFDNVSSDLPSKLYNRFEILTSFEEVETYLLKTEDKSFVLGLGQPTFRESLYHKFIDLGAEPRVVYSKNSEVGSFDVQIGGGTAIMSGVIITNSISIGEGCLININATIGHDCVLKDFVEVSPNVNISGRCTIGKGSSIGTNAIIIPDIYIGQNVIIGAGTVVTKDIPDNCTVVGVPGKIISKRD
ncbi:Serine acetyltransferase [Winogradskyella psychrotolerans RS-3]|uniref:Serine acetyltransferase n=1 Tax=Winogradskyella psychrotolerans RS-3 TaxID=641526 RepID=S7XFF2_9FLAO|nr:acetyltransferase [Winogradskyella psychrotolerans]EPR74703.1 Serine acetyltransferase [Winogradskyella psychrotolerans RS-3]